MRVEWCDAIFIFTSDLSEYFIQTRDEAVKGFSEFMNNPGCRVLRGGAVSITNPEYHHLILWLTSNTPQLPPPDTPPPWLLIAPDQLNKYKTVTKTPAAAHMSHLPALALQPGNMNIREVRVKLHRQVHSMIISCQSIWNSDSHSTLIHLLIVCIDCKVWCVWCWIIAEVHCASLIPGHFTSAPHQHPPLQEYVSKLRQWWLMLIIIHYLTLDYDDETDDDDVENMLRTENKASLYLYITHSALFKVSAYTF